MWPLFILIFSLGLVVDARKPIIVSTPAGAIQGSRMRSTEGNQIHAFRGIPYAKAPVGDLRFQPPQALSQFSSTFDARNEGPACPQRFSELVMSEDCLRLNVYKLASHSQGKKPVIVFIHPGGFYGVSGQSLFFSPQYLLNHDVVLVSINYRLASLGFLSTGDRLAPGNNGFKDQVLALKWIKRNIASFGGDPDNVTIVGYSAGSLSATLHMVSPMSKGLFHRAVAMSAASTSNWKIPNHQLDLAQKQATLLGCPTATNQEMMDCLKLASNTSFVNSYGNFFVFQYNPVFVWGPVIEPDFGQERFLPEDPTKLIQKGLFERVPFMIGITEFEFIGLAYGVVGNETLRTEMNQNWNKIAPISFLYERDTPRSTQISQRLKEFYLRSQDIGTDEQSLKGLGELYADSVIGFAAHRYVNLLAAHTDSPIYYYRFSYRGRYSHFYLPSNTNESIPVGAVHHDELIYLFYISFFPKFNVTDDEYTTVKRLTKMWTDFAKTGNPTYKPSALLENVVWPKFTTTQQKYLDIGSHLLIKERLYNDRYSVWDELFPIEQSLSP